MEDPQKQAFLYIQYLNEGKSPQEAFKAAYPNGVPTALERAKKEAANQQKQSFGQLGGALVGVLGGKAAYDAVTGKPILGGLFSGSETAAPVVDAVAPSTIDLGSTLGASDTGYTLANATGSEATAPLGASVFGSATPYLGAAGTALGAYGAYEGIKKGNPLAAGMGGLGAGLGVNMMGYTLGPWGWAAMAGAPIVAALLNNHESTRDFAKKNTKSLSGMSSDPKWQSYVSSMRQQYDSAPSDPSHPFAGKYATWDEYQRGGLEASDLTGVLGNMKTFGPEWANLSQGQREQVTQGLIDAGLYSSKKGEVVITDPTRAQEIKRGILSGQQNKAATSTSSKSKYDYQREKQNLQTGAKLIGALTK